jgi:hypothetical protein
LVESTARVLEQFGQPVAAATEEWSSSTTTTAPELVLQVIPIVFVDFRLVSF